MIGVTWKEVILCASLALPLAAFFKYGFRFLIEWMLLRADNKAVNRVISERGDEIVEAIVANIVANSNVVVTNKRGTQNVNESAKSIT
jgi:hypothetical protein